MTAVGKNRMVMLKVHNNNDDDRKHNNTEKKNKKNSYDAIEEQERWQQF